MSLGQYGFAVQPPALTTTVWGGSDLLFTDPTDQTIRSWTVDLCAMRGAGTLDSTVDTSARYLAQITWGIGGAREQVLVDWPYAGQTLTVHAETVSVSVLATALQGGPRPVLQGMLSPTRRVSSTMPTLTSANLSIVGLGTGVFTIPPRAVSYRVLYPFSSPIPNSHIVFQCFSGLQVEFDALAPNTNEQTAASQEGLATSRGQYFRLHPFANEVRVSNGNAGPFTYAVQFALDLG
jgi:hypothetical protein